MPGIRAHVAHRGDDDGLLRALQPTYLSPSCRPAEFGIVGCSLSLLGLSGFGGSALLALALLLLSICDLSPVVLQHAAVALVVLRFPIPPVKTVHRPCACHHGVRHLLPRG